MIRIIFICLSLLILGSITNATLSDCTKDGLGTLQEASLEDCDDSQDKCEIEDGKTYNITIRFVTKATIQTAYAHVGMKIPMWNQEINLKKEDICKNENSGVKCPLNNGLIFTYKGSITTHGIKAFKSFIDDTVYWRLVKGDDKKSSDDEGSSSDDEGSSDNDSGSNNKDSQSSKKKKRREAPSMEIVCVKIPIKIK